jgi:hypothetical protein
VPSHPRWLTPTTKWSDVKISLDDADDLIARVGVRAALGWPVPVVAALAGLGLLGGADGYVTAFAALGVLIGWLVILVVILQLRSKRQQRILADRGQTLMNFMRRATEAQAQDPSSFSILDWTEDIEVQENGDSTIVRDFRLRAGADVLQHFSSVCLANEPVRDRQQIRIKAFNVEAGGDVGARLGSLANWESDQRVRVYVYFPTEVPAGAEFRVRIEWSWPAWSRRLAAGDTEEMKYMFKRPCARLRCTIRVAGKPHLTATRFPGHSAAASLAVTQGPGTTRVVTFELDAPPSDADIGFTVDPG